MARGTGPATPKKELAVTLIKERALKGTKRYHERKTVTQCLLDAGYAPSSVRQYTNIMRGIRPHLEETIAWMKEHRLRVAAHMEKKIVDASYRDLTQAFDALTENIQLLEGKPTQNIAVIAETRRRELDALIDQ
jgi:hypothetical protein